MMNHAGTHALVQPLEPRNLLAAGELDPTFGGGDGVLTLGPPMRYQQNLGRVIVRPDGSMLLGSQVWRNAYELRQYTAKLRIDRTFGGDGISTAFIRADRRDAATLSGSLLLDDGSLILTAVAFGRHAFAMRFDARGRFEESFGHDGGTGRAILYRSSAMDDSAFVTLAAASDGRILFALPTLKKFAGFATVHGDVLVGRLTAVGRRDVRFGDRGITVTDLGDRDYPAHVRQLADGGVLVVAQSVNRDFNPIAVVIKLRGGEQRPRF
jgi:hypothetical protein